VCVFGRGGGTMCACVYMCVRHPEFDSERAIVKLVLASICICICVSVYVSVFVFVSVPVSVSVCVYI